MNREEFKKWLDSLKVGDKVVIYSRCFNSFPHITRITRETAKTFYTAQGDFRKSDGKIVGSYASTPQPVTEDIIQEVADRSLVQWFRQFSPSSSNLECLRDMKRAHDSWHERHPSEIQVRIV